MASLAACRRLRVEMDEAPSGRSSPTSTGRSSPTNDASDDPAAAISRIASLFQSLNRLRDAGYGTSVIAAKVAECRAAVVSLPPDLQAKVVALVNAIDDELEGDGAAPVDDVNEIPFGLLDLPPPVLALCCVFAGDSGSLVPRLARTCRAGGEVKPEIMQSRSARESTFLVGTRLTGRFCAQVALRRRDTGGAPRPAGGHAQSEARHGGPVRDGGRPRGRALGRRSEA